LWDALVEAETVMNGHIGSSGTLTITTPLRTDGRDDHAAADEHAGLGGSVVVGADQGLPRSQDRVE
jgi:hypothetical protein